MAFRDWLEQEIRQTEKRVRETRQGSGEWLMAIHQLEVLDECFMQYTKGERIVDERLLKKSPPRKKSITERPPSFRLKQNLRDAVGGSDKFWPVLLTVFFLVVGLGITYNTLARARKTFCGTCSRRR